jgi:hypothetical protein
MATDPAMRNRALLSVYHYGRRGKGPLSGRPVPLAVLPLHRAVTVLLEESEDEPKSRSLHAIRLALADLCRTRGGAPDGTVDREIERLAIAFSKLTDDNRTERDHAEMARHFADIFSEEPVERPARGERHRVVADPQERAYLRALEHMLKVSKKRRLIPGPPERWGVGYRSVADK